MLNTIAICSFGTGNPGSIVNILKKVGCKAKVYSDPKEISDFPLALILPGVGSYDFAVNKLKSKGWFDYLKNYSRNKGNILGICLGMQLLCESSEEGNLNGLEIIPGRFEKFDYDVALKVPHMGWNEVNFTELMPFKLNKLKRIQRFYFVHSYYYKHTNEKFIYAKTQYGNHFGSVIGTDNGRILGVQFHPEKSHNYGINFFKNYLQFLNYA